MRHRGFPRGSSFATVLAEHRGVRNIQHLPHLTIPHILAWADAFHAATGAWPTQGRVPQDIPGTDGERWGNVNQALQKGLRGLPGGSSLAHLLAEHRSVRNSNLLPHLSLTTILHWADAFREATGAWPTVHRAPQLIDGTDGERWRNVDNALRYGLRGLPGGPSLAQLLAQRRGVPNAKAPMTARMRGGR